MRIEQERRQQARAIRHHARNAATVEQRRRLEGNATAIETPTAAARKLPELFTAWQDPDAVRWGQPKGDAAKHFALGVLEQLAASTRCRICGRDLTDPDSIAKGIGPDCLAKLGGLPEWAHTLLEMLGAEEAGDLDEADQARTGAVLELDDELIETLAGHGIDALARLNETPDDELARLEVRGHELAIRPRHELTELEREELRRITKRVIELREWVEAEGDRVTAAEVEAERFTRLPEPKIVTAGSVRIGDVLMRGGLEENVTDLVLLGSGDPLRRPGFVRIDTDNRSHELALDHKVSIRRRTDEDEVEAAEVEAWGPPPKVWG